jgi:hypothetical protein
MRRCLGFKRATRAYRLQGADGRFLTIAPPRQAPTKVRPDLNFRQAGDAPRSAKAEPP